MYILDSYNPYIGNDWATSASLFLLRVAYRNEIYESVSLSMCVYMYVCTVHMCMCVYMYVSNRCTCLVVDRLGGYFLLEAKFD